MQDSARGYTKTCFINTIRTNAGVSIHSETLLSYERQQTITEVLPLTLLRADVLVAMDPRNTITV